MSFQQPPVQVGGGVVLGSAGVKTLAATGAAGIKVLAVVAGGLIATGIALVTKGRDRQVRAGASLED